MTTLILLSVPLLAAVLTGCITRRYQRIIEYSAVLVAGIEALLVGKIAHEVLTGTSENPFSLFAPDSLSVVLLGILTIVGIATAIHSVGHLREEVRKQIIGFRRVRQYFFLFHLFFFAMFVATTTTSPLLTWIAIETTTLTAVFLITFYNKVSALEAGWKLLILNSVGLLIGFLGTLLFLHAGGASGAEGTFLSWQALRENAHSFDPLLIKVAFIFILVGYGTKIGFVPMHTWLPDAHSKAPVPISALLSGVLLNVAFIAMLRFRSIVDVTTDPGFTASLLIGFGILSLGISALIILVQKNYKRMLAYSSIEHMGIMGLGFGFGPLAGVASLFHMLYHALLKATLFLSAGNFFLRYSSTKIEHIRGALQTIPFSATVFLLALFAISGAPPSGVFFTELSIFSVGTKDHTFIVSIAVIALVIAFAGFMSHAMHMLYGERPENVPVGEANYWTIASIGFLISIFVLLSIWIPAPLNTLITNATAIIY